MSDFDNVLERLLSDPAFAAELSRDPDGALSGYRLDSDETAILRSQIATDTQGAVSAVEARTTKSSTFGMFSSLGDAFDFSNLGAAAGSAARQTAEALVHGGSGGGIDIPARTGLGDASGHDLDELTAVSGLGDRPNSGLGDAESVPLAANVQETHQAPVEVRAPEVPAGYAPQVDADGDGRWDTTTYVGREDGGVDILIDLNNDGNPDFVGRDLDADGLIDNATIDADHDGVFEKTMYDDNSDGWLDRTVWQND